MERIILKLDDMKAELRRQGFTHVESMAGPLSIEAWDPYGKNGVNKFPGGNPWQGELAMSYRREADGSTEGSVVEDGLAIFDRPDGWEEWAARGMPNGVWSPLKLEEVPA